MIEELIQGFDVGAFQKFLRSKFGSFSASGGKISVDGDSAWAEAERIGVVKTLPGPNGLNMPLVVVAAKLGDGEMLKERSSRVRQFKFARKVLDEAMGNPAPGVEGVLSQGLFVFYDDHGNFRLSLVYGRAEGTKLVWSAVRRLSFYVEAGDGNRTFRDRVALPWATFDKLKDAFSVEKLTKEFYSRLFKWYQWALSDEMGVTYPNDTDTDEDDRQISEHIIRLITRLMFVWFLKQKHLIPDELFEPGTLKHILRKFDPVAGDNYYRAIIQNLFFATLNSEIPERGFATQTGDRTEHFDIKTLYRYPKEFAISEAEVLELFKGIPFLNGGLFECLDRGRNYYDGFSRNRNRAAKVPNRLFFDPNEGLIPLLQQYNFTVEENSPGDEEVALDPELLGKVFENLLASYNPETNVQARKATGSFYTPREIVNYMVDESLIAHLKARCGDEHEESIRQLFAAGERPEDAKLRKAMDEALVTAKILDPACGSGAFPMGMLLRMVDVLRVLRGIPEDDPVYELKLELIENCIYGADIQCIAVQISKLRFFISLVCEQKPTDDPEENYGIHSLPNLETKFVAANSLIGLPHDGHMLPMQDVETLKKQLWNIRHRHFLARSYQEKKELRKEDRKLRTELAKALELGGGFDTDSAKLMAEWDPYDQNTSASFLDAEWMFNVAHGFDVVLGNPPFGAHFSDREQSALALGYATFTHRGESYILFVELAVRLLNIGGQMALIVPDTYLNLTFTGALRSYLLANAEIREIVLLPAATFESATVDTTVLMLAHHSQPAQGKFRARVFAKAEPLVSLAPGMGKDIELDSAALDASGFNITASPAQAAVLARLEAEAKVVSDEADVFYGIKVYQVGKGKPPQTRDMVDQKPFTAATRQGKEWLPFYDGKDVTRYGLLWDQNNWLHYGPWLAEPRTPAKFEGEKLLIRKIVGDTLLGTYVPHTSYCNTLLAVVKLRPDSQFEYKPLLGILNSRLMGWYIRSKLQISADDTFPQILIGNVRSLPLPPPDSSRFECMEMLVDSILARKADDGNADVSGEESELDQHIYSLYGLTPDEIAVVAGSAGGGRTPDAGRPTAGGRAGRGRGKKAGEQEPMKSRKRKAALPPSLPGWD